LNNTITKVLQNRGNRRLWLVCSLLWAVGAGWYFWKDPPPYQQVDASQLVSELCRAGEQADIQAAEEEEYQNCMSDRHKSPNPHSDLAGQGVTSETVCGLVKLVPSAEVERKAHAVAAKCIESNLDATEKRLQPEADRATDQARANQLVVWVAETILPPFALPLSGIAIFFLASFGAQIATWISAGYRKS
jgi:hypothetical protein